MKKSIGLLALVSALVLVACGGGERYPEEVRVNFLAACERTSGGATSACECSLEELEQSVPFEEFEKIEANILAGGAPTEEVTDALAKCT